jgi:hypothetical protein
MLSVHGIGLGRLAAPSMQSGVARKHLKPITHPLLCATEIHPLSRHAARLFLILIRVRLISLVLMRNRLTICCFNNLRNTQTPRELHKSHTHGDDMNDT